MQTINIDLNNHGGPIKPMNAVNNGPSGSKVRRIKGNFNDYAAANIPFARNHDASFYSGYGGEHTVDVHRIFKNFDADENNPASYVFEPTDDYISDTISAGTKVFYRLGASIEHGYKEGTYPPKNFEKWARICEHIILHYTEGWADGFKYDIEYWEIWNEPDCRNADGSNPCWQGTEDEFIEFYEVAAKYLKERFPHLKIGGPAFCGPWSKPGDFKSRFLKAVKERNIPFDFYSFHCYAKEPLGVYETAVEASRQLEIHGLSGIPTILNEFNYVRGWFGDEYEYSMKSIKGLKGGSFLLGSMLACQESPLDMLMYYEARPCSWSGLWNTDGLTPLKAYYSLVVFDVLAQLGTWVKADNRVDDVYYCAATNGTDSALALTYFNDDDTSPVKRIKVGFENVPLKQSLAEIYVIDENNNLTLVSEQIFETDKFAIYIDAKLYNSYLIKIKTE